jgi:hypothetical protein
MWGAILFIFLLFGGGIAVYWFLIRKKSAQKYSCKGNTCTKDPQGTYDFLDDCKKKCPNTCSVDAQGTYESQYACNQACKKQKPSGSNAYCGKAWNHLDCNTPCPNNEKEFCTKRGYANCFANSSLTPPTGPLQCPPPKQLQMLGSDPI